MSTATFTPRKATFHVEGKGKERVFTAVNKRAHTVCKKAGKRTHVTYEQLKSLQGAGSYIFCTAGDLKTIKL